MNRYLFLGSSLFLLILIFLDTNEVRKENLVGCYTQKKIQPADKICLHFDGTYKQYGGLDMGIPKEYNSGVWLFYSAKVNNDVMAGVTLKNFYDKLEGVSELDLFPYKDIFGEITFNRSAGGLNFYYVKTSDI